MSQRTSSPVLVIAAALTLVGCAKETPEAPEEVEPTWVTPEIDDVGRVAEVPAGAPVRPRPGVRRIVVDITSTPVNQAETNPGLVDVARLLNLYASRGVEPDGLDVIALLGEDAATAALEPKAYEGLHGVVADPNSDVISALTKRGVELMVDGQALAERKLDPKRVRDEVSVAPAGDIALVELQLDGYALLRK